MPTPRAQMNSLLVASYLAGRTLLSILLCEFFCGRGDQPLPVAVARPGVVQGVRAMKPPGPAMRGCSPGQKPAG